MSTIDPRDPGEGGRDDRDAINARFEQLVAPLREESPGASAPRGTRPGHNARPHPGTPATPRPTQPFSLDAAMAAAEPDDEPLELPVLPRPRMRPGLVVGFALLATAFVLAFLAMLGVRVGHDLGVVGIGLGIIGLVVLLLNVRRGERDDSLDHDPRDGSRV